MRNNPKNTGGFTFVETLITFSVVGIFLALTWATVNFLLIKSNEQIVRTRAHFFAMEGIEITKQIRQTAVNSNRETGFSDSIGGKENSYKIESRGDGFVLSAGEDELIEMHEEPFINYCRTINFESVNSSETIKKIVSTVNWGGSDCTIGEYSISYSTYLADLKH